MRYYGTVLQTTWALQSPINAMARIIYENTTIEQGSKITRLVMTTSILNSLFKTVKYHPSCPASRFDSIEPARAWMENFTQWYNGEPLHSNLKFVAPKQRHTSKDKAILKNRDQVYKPAQERNSQRWSANTRNWFLPESVTLNSDQKSTVKNYREQNEALMAA
jgi:putative transposase